ncbi:protein of unknown function (plasmid) [Thermococcus nautili]|nr:protein of unknown function [Thermococcus nautili]
METTQTQTPTQTNPTKTILKNAYTIPLGPTIELKVIATEFYSRYTTRYNHRDFRRYRAGFWFLMALTDSKTGETIYIIDGDGEKEGDFPFNANPGKLLHTGMSGAEDYENGHITCGGWYYLYTPYTTKNPEDIDFLQNPTENPDEGIRLIKSLDDLNDDERIFLSKLIQRNVLKYLTALIDAIPFYDHILNLDLPYAGYIPLLKTYISSRTENLPLDANIYYEPKSWRAWFIFGDIKVYVPKARHRYYDNEGDYIVIYFDDKKETTIFYREDAGRKTVYLAKNLNNEYPLFLGWEEYNDHVHPRAEIDIETIRKVVGYYTPEYMNLLFNRRLGDVLFINADEIFHTENDLKKLSILTPATKEALKKVQFIGATIEETEHDGETIITIKPTEGATEIIAYHPEHGILRLPPKEFTLYEVPYIVRGHD